VNVFGGSGFKVRLFVPSPYDLDAHERAEDSGDFRALRIEQPVTVATDAEWTVLEVPPVTPWGILVLERR
jgi:hypothetical protein